MESISKKSEETLRNSHSTLKWMWTIVMALAVAKAIEIFFYCYESDTGTETLKSVSDFSIRSLLLIFIFIFTIVRFYHGDSRFLHRVYLEIQLEKFNPKIYSFKWIIFDFYWLLWHAILFYTLAAYQSNFPYFFWIFLILLAADSIRQLGIRFFRALPEKDTQVAWKWCLNNFFHVIALILIYFFTRGLEANYSDIYFFIFALTNTLIDYYATYDYYFSPEIESAK